MRLIEADGKALLGKFGVAAPQGRLVGPDHDPGAPRTAVLKAQLLTGGRGKAGLIRLVTAADFAETVTTLRNALQTMDAAPWLLIEETIDIGSEYYIGITVDDVRRCPLLLFSTEGGIEIEANPESLHTFPIDPQRGLVVHEVVRFLRTTPIAPAQIAAVSRLAAAMWAAFRTEDAELIEINPLAVTKAGKLVALDAKVVLDDNAAHRHPSRQQLVSYTLGTSGLSEIEKRAAKINVTWVEMDGCVAMLTGGAGLGMMTLDMLADAGLSAGCFLDGSGGSGEATFREQTNLIVARAAKPDIKGILVYFTLAAQSLEPVVKGVLSVLDQAKIDKPVVVGLAATAAAEIQMTTAQAREAFESRGYPFFTELDQAVNALAQRIQNA